MLRRSQPPRAGAGSAPRTGQRLARAGSSRGRRRERGGRLRLSSPLSDIPASSARCARDAAYSATGFEVWATARLGPGWPRRPEGREAARRARSVTARPVPGHPGGVAASHPRAWEPQALSRTRGPAWRSLTAASYLAGPLSPAQSGRAGTPRAAGRRIRPLAAPGHGGRGLLRGGMSCPQQHWAPPEVTPESGAGLRTGRQADLGRKRADDGTEPS